MLRAMLCKLRYHRKGWDRLMSEISRFDRLSTDAARKEMAGRLLAQIQYFGNRSDALPEWKEFASIDSADELWREWESLPIIGKHELQTRFHPDKIRALGVTGESSSTGGSTGEPTPYLHDAAMSNATAAARLYVRIKLGWRPGMPMICVWGSQRDIGKIQETGKGLSAYMANMHLVDGYNLSEDTVDRFLELVAEHRQVAVYGFTSMLEFLARRVIERDQRPSLGKVAAAWNGGEMLFDNQVQLFKDAFGIPLMNLYGGRELSAMAYQVAGTESLRIVRPYLFCEIVDDSGKTVEPGQTGRLVWTSTVCRGTPFLRYDIGDLACYSAEQRDGSGLTSLKELHGRAAGLLTLANGKTINCLYWNHLMKDFPEVEQFQIAVRGSKPLEIRLKGTGFSQERETHLRQVLLDFLGNVPVEIHWLHKIALTSQGKLVQVIREDD